MNMTHIVTLSWAVLCLAQASAPLLDEFFSSEGFTIVHGRYLPNFEVKSGVDKARVVREVTRFLRRESGALETEFDRGANLAPPLRSREYWALVLAEMTGERFILNIGDSSETRERKIRALLQSVGASEKR